MTQAPNHTPLNRGALPAAEQAPTNCNQLDRPSKQTQLNQPPQLTHRELKDKILSKVGEDLASIENALHANLTPHLDLVSEIAGHLLFSGGKRLRPLLMVLSSRLCGYSGELAVKFSTIFEYLHAATLLHDDVVDEAGMRRGKVAAHARWSLPKVVLTGDFLLARSLSLAAETGIPAIIGVMAGITEDMSQGEIDQMVQKGRVDLTEEDYLTIIKRKTAVLIQGACRSGALIANADKAQEDALDLYGYHLGMAFQMADDLLDYTGDSATLGKKPGADIREGKLTLPLIHALSVATGEDRVMMEHIIRDSLSGCDNSAETNGCCDRFGAILEKLHLYQSVEYTQLQAQNHVAQAKENLELFGDCEARELMMMLADYSISRKV